MDVGRQFSEWTDPVTQEYGATKVLRRDAILGGYLPVNRPRKLEPLWLRDKNGKALDVDGKANVEAFKMDHPN